MDVTSYLLGKQAGGGSTPTLQNKSVTITENGTTNVTADAGYDGLGTVGITTNVQPDLETKSVTITENTTTTITPSQGKDGLSSVEVITNVSGGGADEYFTSSISEGSYYSGTNWYNGVSHMIKEIPANTTVSGSSLEYAFFRCNQLTSVPLFDTSNVTNFRNCFNGCSALTTIPALDTSKAQYLSSTFANCTNLTTLPVFNWGQLREGYQMFLYCNNLTDTSLDNILQSCITTTSVYTTSKNLYYLFSYSYAQTVYPASRIQALPHYQDFLDAGWSIGY